MNYTITLHSAKVIEQAEINMLSTRLLALQTMEKNPMQVNMKQFENATAFSSKIISGPPFNTVKGEVKEVVGKVTDNKELQATGKWDKIKGTVKHTAGNVTEKVHAHK